MQFDTYTYALFLPLVFFIYWGLRRHLKWQNLFLLVASYVFYGWWDWRMLCLIILTSVTTWGSAMLMRGDRSRADKTWAALNIVLNLGILCMFKYLNFLRDSLVHFLGLFGVNPDWPTLYILLPVGISFYTFQAISYTVDVYRGEIKPTRDVVAFGVFIAFFPQLVAGPIERATNLLPQFLRTKTFDYETAVVGMRQILWGLAKKLIIADGMGHYVNQLLENPYYYSASSMVWAGILFAVQIYADFSGYSDIAIGPFGVRLMTSIEFARPLAHGIQHNGGVLALRFVARSRLDVRDMGYCQRPAAIAFHLHAAPSIEGRCDLARVAALPVDVPDICRRVPRVQGRRNHPSGPNLRRNDTRVMVGGAAVHRGHLLYRTLLCHRVAGAPSGVSVGADAHAPCCPVAHLLGPAGRNRCCKP